jgi:ClpP class serine protease
VVVVVFVDGVVDVVYSFRRFVDEGLEVVKGFEEFLGFPVVPILFGVSRYINARSVDSVFSVLREFGCVDRLGVVLFSGGGDIDEAYLLATYLQGIVREWLVTYVPRYVKSAGTLLALAGDEVVMLPIAELGPIDPVIYDSKTGRYIPLQSILEILDLLSRKDISKEVINAILERVPVIELGDYKRAVEHNAELCMKILTNRMLKGDINKAREIAEKLVSFKQHSAAITVRDAKELGLNVREAKAEEVEYLWKLHKLWTENIIELENLQPPETVEPIEFKFGKGIVLTVAPKEIIEEVKKSEK